jgi:indolepyruvate ferredoxin oxidoreductase
LARAVAEGAFRAFAIKDEYEVARLHAAADYGEAPVFHMAPPLVSGTDKATGRRRKLAISGRIALPLFRALRHGKVLRGTPLDAFGWQAERRAERAYARQYEHDVSDMLPHLRPDTLDPAVSLASLPMAVRGFGPIKAAAMADAGAQRAALLARLGAAPLALAAE